MEIEQSLKQSAIALLKAKVEERFGYPIRSYRDCLLLQEDIQTRTSLSLNLNTLRRFFGIIKASGGPSPATIDILVRYCGYHSLRELQQHSGEGGVDEGFISRESVSTYILNLFRQTPVKRQNDETFLSVTKGVIQFLQKHPALTYGLQPEIARTKCGQDYYFEQFVHIDALPTTYGDGLRYYLKEKRNIEAQIFAISMLLLRAWLTGDRKGLETWHAEGLKKTLAPDIHPFVAGRHYASRLYYAEAFGLPTDVIIQEARRTHLAIAPHGDNWRSFPGFEYTMSIALVLTGAYEEGLYYLTYADDHYRTKHSYIEEGYYEMLALMKGIALAKTGRKEESEKIYKRLNPVKFYFLHKKACTVLYLLLARYLGKRDEDGEEQIKLLVAQTGLVKFLDLI